MELGGPWQVALVDDPERVQPCDREISLGEGSAHVVSRTGRDQVRHSLRISAGGSRTVVHERSLLLDGDRALVAIGAWLCAVDLPLLGVEWAVEVDWAQCLAVYPLGDDYLTQGAVSVTRVGRGGKIRWQASGRDVLMRLTLEGDSALVEDFRQNRFRIDLTTGRIEEGR